MNHDRRAFLAALIGSALVPPESWAADRVHVIGYLSGGGRPQDFITQPLAELGYVEGRNLRFETRIPPNWEPETLAAAARELVAARPDVLLAQHPWRVHALATATRSIPIVSMGTADPLSEGLAKSLARPGGNVTGISFGLPETTEATMRLLKQMRPSLRRVAIVYEVEPRPAFFERAALAAGLEPEYLRMREPMEMERALRPFAGQALFLAPGKQVELMERVTDVANGLRIATVSTTNHALMIYGLDFQDRERRVAAIIDKILRGAKPAEIPIELPDRPSFRLNRSVARRIGIDVPPDVMLRVTDLVD